MPAKVFPRPVIEPDRPWESRAIAHYGTVLPDPDGGYRMYYTDFSPEKRDAARQQVGRRQSAIHASMPK